MIMAYLLVLLVLTVDVLSVSSVMFKVVSEDTSETDSSTLIGSVFIDFNCKTAFSMAFTFACAILSSSPTLWAFSGAVL